MRTSRLIAAAGTAAVLATGTAGPAVAADPPTAEQWRVSETAAVVSWVEQDPEDSTGRPGTVHVGGLFFDSVAGTAGVFAGALADWDCEPGRLPWDEGADCVLLAEYEVSDADVRLELDRRAGTAHVTGTVTFYDVAGLEPDVWTVPVDLRWTTAGKPLRTRSHTRDVADSTTFVMHTRTLTWPTISVEGTVGSMVLGDEPGELNEERLWVTEDRFFLLTRRTGPPTTDGGGTDGGGMG